VGEHGPLDLFKVLWKEVGVEDGVFSDIKVFTPGSNMGHQASPKNDRKQHSNLLKMEALGLNHQCLVEVRDAWRKCRPQVLKSGVIINLTASDTAQHCHGFLERALEGSIQTDQHMHTQKI